MSAFGGIVHGKAVECSKHGKIPFWLKGCPQCNADAVDALLANLPETTKKITITVPNRK